MKMDMERGWYYRYKIVLTLYLLVTLFSVTRGFERKLTYTLNPGCTSDACNSTGISLVHVLAVGRNDSLHYLWDFEGKPSILIALTSHNSSLHVDWDSFLFGEGGKSVKFSELPAYTFGVVLNKIVEFNDVNDTGYLDINNKSENYVRYLDTEFFKWERSLLKQSDQGVVLNIEANSFKNNVFTRNGSLKIMLSGFGFREHSPSLPHLLHTANSTVVEVEIDRLQTEASFQNSRYALEFVLASSDLSSESMKIDVRKSLDDEETPGVFTVVDLLTPSCETNPWGGGFLQWRPVAYVARNRSLANSTETSSYQVSRVENPTTLLNSTLLYAYYGYDLVNSTLVQETVVSFGLKEDGFYKKTNYTSWAFTIGYGKPPNEEFSLLIILVICIGLGLPALLIAVSGIVFTIRRLTRKKDELCLSR